MCLYYCKTADNTSLNVIVWFSCPQYSLKLKYDAKFYLCFYKKCHTEKTYFSTDNKKKNIKVPLQKYL